MRRGVMAGVMTILLMMGMAVPARAEEERGTIRVKLGQELAGKTVTLYSVGEIAGGEAELSGDLGQGKSRKLSGDGSAMFTGLPEGKYLLTLEDSMSVLIVLPEEDGSWMAQIAPGMVYIAPETGQPYEPVLWAMAMVLSAFGIGIWYENWHMRKRK